MFNCYVFSLPQQPNSPVMASGGYGRGGRGAALLQALSQQTRKPGSGQQEEKDKPTTTVAASSVSALQCELQV